MVAAAVASAPGRGSRGGAGAPSGAPARLPGRLTPGAASGRPTGPLTQPKLMGREPATSGRPLAGPGTRPATQYSAAGRAARWNTVRRHVYSCPTQATPARVPGASTRLL